MVVSAKAEEEAMPVPATKPLAKPIFAPTLFTVRKPLPLTKVDVFKPTSLKVASTLTSLPLVDGVANCQLSTSAVLSEKVAITGRWSEAAVSLITSYLATNLLCKT
ncbi:hypothetical protein D3C85_1072230 [compost metagenome]